MGKWKYTRATYVVVVVSWVIYALLTLLAPKEANTRFHLSEPELLLLQLTIIIPIHLIWLMAVRGATTFKQYASMIAGSPDADGVNQIADGLLWTLAYFIVTSITGALAPYFANSRTYDGFIIFRDHLAPFISLVAFFLLYRGSHLLRRVTNFVTWTRGTAVALTIFGLFAFLFVLEFALSPTFVTPSATRNALMIMPHGVLLFTIILPYIVAWFLGMLACINITKYAAGVKGQLYRKALSDLVWGIWSVIGFAVAIQAITFAGRFLSSLSLGAILLIVYALLALYGVGFLFVRAGAHKLARIEVAR